MQKYNRSSLSLSLFSPSSLLYAFSFLFNKRGICGESDLFNTDISSTCSTYIEVTYCSVRKQITPFMVTKDRHFRQETNSKLTAADHLALRDTVNSDGNKILFRCGYR